MDASYKQIQDATSLEVHQKQIATTLELMQQTCPGSVGTLKVISSSGGSYVLLSPDCDYVYQVFVNEGKAEYVHKLTEVFNLEATIDLVCPGPGMPFAIPYQYQPRNYLANAELYFPDNHTIAWVKISTLNQYEESELMALIQLNMAKLLWDIGLGLHALHTQGVRHADVRLDNIGINDQGNFVLFDFDGSLPVAKAGQTHRDFAMLAESIKFLASNTGIVLSEPNATVLDAWVTGGTGARAILRVTALASLIQLPGRPTRKDRIEVCTEALQTLTQLVIVRPPAES